MRRGVPSASAPCSIPSKGSSTSILDTDCLHHPQSVSVHLRHHPLSLNQSTQVPRLSDEDIIQGGLRGTGYAQAVHSGVGIPVSSHLLSHRELFVVRWSEETCLVTDDSTQVQLRSPARRARLPTSLPATEVSDAASQVSPETRPPSPLVASPTLCKTSRSQSVAL
jgi:hypothetical protein